VAAEDLDKSDEELVSRYYFELDAWLHDKFNGLKTVDDWKDLYVKLVHRVATLANKNRSAEDLIDPKLVILPLTTDLFQASRLLFQALGTVRNAIPDGQHRIAAMVNVLTGYMVSIDTNEDPPKMFLRKKFLEHRALMQTENGETATIFCEMLRDCAIKIQIKILAPTTYHLEAVSQTYSTMREHSQSSHKPRILADA
jgi:hypothetical protein